MKSSVARNPERELFRMLGQQSTARDLRRRVEKVQLLLEPPHSRSVGAQVSPMNASTSLLSRRAALSRSRCTTRLHEGQPHLKCPVHRPGSIPSTRHTAPATELPAVCGSSPSAAWHRRPRTPGVSTIAAACSVLRGVLPAYAFSPHPQFRLGPLRCLRGRVPEGSGSDRRAVVKTPRKVSDTPTIVRMECDGVGRPVECRQESPATPLSGNYLPAVRPRRFDHLIRCPS